jgi:hypothetical protein
MKGGAPTPAAPKKAPSPAVRTVEVAARTMVGSVAEEVKPPGRPTLLWWRVRWQRWWRWQRCYVRRHHG